MTTNDHTVPQMHLRRFARKVRKGGRQIAVLPVEDPSATFVTNVRNITGVKGFYWGLDPDGVEHHDWERLLTTVESAAAPVIAQLLNDPQYALPLDKWPLDAPSRAIVAYWMAAQLLRTTRQRHWLATQQAGPVPPVLQEHQPDSGERHAEFFQTQLLPLTATLFLRPWGLVFSDACLPTGDVPVLIANAQDHPAPAAVATVCDVYVPLDPHRLLILPNPAAVLEDHRKQQDHVAKLDGGLGIFLGSMLFAAADRHLLYHPDHVPDLAHAVRGPRLPAPWRPDDKGTEITTDLNYGCLPPGATIEARWLREHPPPRSI